MQTIVTILADLVVLATSILLIVTRVHGILNRILWVAVVTTMCFFLIAYVATCANKGKCEWTSQEFKEVFFCTVRPDRCTHLLPKLAGAAEAEYWKKKASEHQGELERLRREKGGEGRDQVDLESKRRLDEAKTAMERQAVEARRQAERAQEEADRQRRIAEAAEESRLRAEEARAEAERQRVILEEETEKRRRESAEADEARREAEAAAEIRRQEVERSAQNLTFRLRSDYPHAVDLEFYSVKSNRAWPGNGRVWILSDSEVHTYSLNCIPGEQICFGAWVRGNSSRYWGVGFGGRQGCTNCCYHCGQGETNIIVLGQ